MDTGKNRLRLPLSGRAFRAYNRRFLVAAACLLVGMASFNAVVDPFALHNTPRFAGFNTHKPAFYSHLRLAKPAVVRRVRPTCLILGSSTAEVGLDPLHPGWKGENVYNFGVSGATIHEVSRYLRYAHETQRLRRVVVLLDFFMFNVHYRPGCGPELDEDLGTGWAASAKRTCKSLWSVDALEQSLETLRYNYQNIGREDATVYLDQGQHPPGFLGHSLAQGHRAAFLRCEQDYITLYYFPPPLREYAFATEERQGVPAEDAFDHFRDIVNFSRDERIELICAIAPSHARMCEAIDAAGLWTRYEEWKRTLTAIVDDDGSGSRSADDGRVPVRLWDFSGYNSVTTEPVPADGDAQSRTKWYWESIHFRKELGDLLLDRVLDFDGGRSPPDFGVPLTSRNLDACLDAARTARADYRSTHSDDDEIASVARAAGHQPAAETPLR